MSEQGSGVSLSLDDLFREGVPASPIEDFEKLVADLRSELVAVQRRQEELDAEKLRRADQLVEALRSECDRTRERIRILEAIRAEFVGAGDLARPSLESIRAALAALDAHAQRVEARLRHPDLERANERRQERVRHLRERIPDRIRPEATVDEVEDTLDEMLRLGLPGDDRTVEPLMESFEAAIRQRGALHHLPAVARFWKHVSRKGDEIAAAAARDRALAIEREIAEREAHREVNERAAREAVGIRRDLDGFERLGPEEQHAQLALWLGRLRRFQDDFELDADAAREVHYSFGALNNARKRFGVEGYFDALDRSFSTNWERYVAEWERRLPEARRKDRIGHEEERRRETERQAREKADAEQVAERKARLDAVVDELNAIAGDGGWRLEAETRDEIRELLCSGVEAEGCGDARFVDASVPFAELAQGGDLRRLRRALAKRGVEVDASSAPSGADGDAALTALRPSWQGRRLAIVGGLPRREVADRLKAGLGLAELRWFECFHGRDQLDQADASIRAGAFDHVVLLVRFSGHDINKLREPCLAAGVACARVDRGCGVRAIGRALAGAA